MKKIYYVVFLSLFSVCSIAVSIEQFNCPTAEQMHSYKPERTGPTSATFWFGGKLLKWTPMAFDVTISFPFDTEKVRPQPQPVKINLIDYPGGGWKIECTYQDSSGTFSVQNVPVSDLTIQASEASSCVLTRETGTVMCQMK